MYYEFFLFNLFKLHSHRSFEIYILALLLEVCRTQTGIRGGLTGTQEEGGEPFAVEIAVWVCHSAVEYPVHCERMQIEYL